MLLKANYNGPELPANYTMDQISLGDLETVTPVFGPLWSTYGYRDHPIDGEYRFHNGVDIGAYQGDPHSGIRRRHGGVCGGERRPRTVFPNRPRQRHQIILRTLQQDLCDHGTDRVRGGEGGRGGVHRELHWVPTCTWS